MPQAQKPKIAGVGVALMCLGALFFALYLMIHEHATQNDPVECGGSAMSQGDTCRETTNGTYSGQADYDEMARRKASGYSSALEVGIPISIVASLGLVGVVVYNVRRRSSSV